MCFGKAVIFLNKGGCFGLLLDVNVGGVDVFPQFGGGSTAEDKAFVVRVWMHLVRVVDIRWSGENWRLLAELWSSGLPGASALNGD